MSARVSVFAAARAPRGRPVSLVCSCSLGAPAPGIAAIAAGRGRRTSGVEVSHQCLSMPMPVSQSLSASGTSYEFRADGDALAQPLNLINTDPVRPVQPSVQYF